MFSKRSHHKAINGWKYSCKNHHFWHVFGHLELDQKKGSKRLHSCPFLPQESISYINVLQAILYIKATCVSTCLWRQKQDEVLKRARSSKPSRTWTEVARILDKGLESRFSVPGPNLETDLKRGSQKENPSLGTWNEVLREKTCR
jgi:hypothetical protein